MPEPDSVDELIRDMADMTDAERQMVFYRLKQSYCDDCGSKAASSQCNCTRDD